MTSKNSLLITGSSGFVGSNLYDALHMDYILYGLDITTQGRFSAETVFGWDHLDQLPDVDAIIHLAGKAHDVKNTGDAQSYFDINTGLTQKIFDYFLRSDAKRFIFFSSVKAVADSVSGKKLTEADHPTPLTPYGRSKLKAENYILGTPLPVGKVIYILRPCMIHGPGNKGNLNLLYSVVSKGLPWPLGAYDNKRSFLSIENLCFIIKKILQGSVPPGIYNLADNDVLSTNDIVALIAQEHKKRLMIWRLPKPMIQLAAKLGNLFQLPLNEDNLLKLTENYIVSNEKILRALGEPLPISLKNGMIVTIRSFMNNQ